MGGLGSGCNVIGENTVGGPREDEVFDGYALSTESTSFFILMYRSATPLVEHVWWVKAIVSHFLIVVNAADVVSAARAR